MPWARQILDGQAVDLRVALDILGLLSWRAR
jgi:hypothetical protein